jgi:hypothetical protein
MLRKNVFVWIGGMVGCHPSINDNCWLTACANVSWAVSMGKSCYLAVNGAVAHGIAIDENSFIGVNRLVKRPPMQGRIIWRKTPRPFA